MLHFFANHELLAIELIALALLRFPDADPGWRRGLAAILGQAMGKAVGSVQLRVWTPQHAELLFVKQVAPDIADLTGSARPGPNPLTRDFPTGAWGTEERDYHVAIRVKAAAVGEVAGTEMAGRSTSTR